MSVNTERAVIGLGVGFVLFLIYMLSGCAEQINIYINDNNATSRLEQPIIKDETKKGKESFEV